MAHTQNFVQARAEALLAIVTPPRLAPTESSRRWASLLRQILEVEPLRCPRPAATQTARLQR